MICIVLWIRDISVALFINYVWYVAYWTQYHDQYTEMMKDFQESKPDVYVFTCVIFYELVYFLTYWKYSTTLCYVKTSILPAKKVHIFWGNFLASISTIHGIPYWHFLLRPRHFCTLLTVTHGTDTACEHNTTTQDIDIHFNVRHNI